MLDYEELDEGVGLLAACSAQVSLYQSTEVPVGTIWELAISYSLHGHTGEVDCQFGNVVLEQNVEENGRYYRVTNEELLVQEWE